MAKRKQLGKKKRFDVFKRDRFQCQYCGRTPPSVVLEVDHIIAVSSGGTNSEDNLVTSCFDCNRGKAANSLSDIPKTLAEKAEIAREREFQLLEFNKILTEIADRIEDDAWEIAAILENNPEIESYNKARMQSIKTFLGRLPASEVASAAEKASARFFQPSSRSFRYFCGICWNKITEYENG